MAVANLLAVGEPAPEFSYCGADGEVRSTDSLQGRPFLVYFYPKDNTPGCVREACGFRDMWVAFEEVGMEVIGVSVDSDASHAKFRERFRLPFGLAADTDHRIAKAFGVWNDNNLRDKLLPFVRRVSFLIGPDQRVAKVYPKVDPAAHADEVIDDYEQQITNDA